MARNEDLIIRIGARSEQFKNELDSIKKQTAALDQQLATVAKTSGIAFAALSAGIGTSVAAFANFERGFSNVVTLLDKSSFGTKNFNQEVRNLEKGVLALSARTGKTFDELNQALFDLISAGVPAGKALDSLAAASDLATAGATTTDLSVKALTASLTAFGDEAGSATDISEKFFTAQKFGVTTVGALASEFNKVGGQARALGVSFDEALAAATSLTANGAKPTSEAFTELRSLMTGVINAQKNLADESLAVQQALSLENVERVGLVEAIRQTSNAVGGNVVELQRLLGSELALSAAISLTTSQSELFTKILGELGNASSRATAFQNALAKQQSNTTEATARLRSSISAASAVIGGAFAPSVNASADTLAKLVTFILQLDDGTIKSIATFLAFSAAGAGLVTTLALVGRAVLFLRTGLVALGITMGVVSAPITIVVGALAALTLGIKAFVDEFKNADGVVGSIARGIQAAFEGVTSSVRQGFDALKEFFGAGDTLKATSPEQRAEAAAERRRAAEQAEQDVAEEYAEKELERIREQNERKREIDQEERELALETRAERLEEDLELEQQALDSLLGVRSGAMRRELIAKRNVDKAKTDSEKDQADKRFKIEKTLSEGRVDLQNFVTAEGGKAQKALFLIQKAFQFGRAINNTAEAVTAALPNLGLAATVGAIGAAQAGAIAASAVTQAATGGIVGGGVGGKRDNQLFALQPGELIVPKNQVPNFLQSVGSLNSGTISQGNGGEMKVDIGIQPEAAQFITLSQRENKSLGVSGDV